MSRLSRGDRDAFDRLYAGLAPRALRAARLRVGAVEAHDVAQQVLERVFARASDFTPGRPCLPWFYAIVHHELQASRRRGARLVLDETAAVNVVATGTDADPEGALLQRELERALASAIEELDADAAAAIGALLGRTPTPEVKPATLRKRLSRAYVKLRLLLRGDHVG